ncbi:uncharacterized protein LOC135394134 [Ornithodoros turicata]
MSRKKPERTDRVADGSETPPRLRDSEQDPDAEEFSRLRCSSIQTEEVAERNRRNNRQPSAGYPGLAFGGSIFSSGTLMRFRIISNELHNITNVQLKRVEGEVSALKNRIKTLEENLGKEETDLKHASAEVSQVAKETEEACAEKDSANEMSELDTQLSESKLRYEEMAKQIALLDAGFEPSSLP